MAQKKSETSSGTRVRRIKATDDAPKKQPAAKSAKATAKKKEVVKQPKPAVEKPSKNPFKAMAGYFKGAWYELKQVRWPNRASTWSMTGAVLLFTAFFVVLVLLLDTGFNWVFEQLLR